MDKYLSFPLSGLPVPERSNQLQSLWSRSNIQKGTLAGRTAIWSFFLFFFVDCYWAWYEWGSSLFVAKSSLIERRILFPVRVWPRDLTIFVASKVIPCNFYVFYDWHIKLILLEFVLIPIVCKYFGLSGPIKTTLQVATCCRYVQGCSGYDWFSVSYGILPSCTAPRTQ
mgnify:CR=1 FL=1